MGATGKIALFLDSFRTAIPSKFQNTSVRIKGTGKAYLSLAATHNAVGLFDIDPTKKLKISYGVKSAPDHLEFEISGNARKDKPTAYFLKLAGHEMAFQPLVDVNAGGEAIMIGSEHGNLAYDIQQHITETVPRYLFAVTLEDGVVKVESLSIRKGVHVYLERQYDDASMRALLRQNSLVMLELFAIDKWKRNVDYTEINVPDMPGLKLDMIMRSGVFSFDGRFLAYLSEHENDINMHDSLVISFLKPVEEKGVFSVQLDYNEEINGPLPVTIKDLINRSLNNARIMAGYA